MRVTSGGCYEIAGTAVRRLGDAGLQGDAVARWRERQADLWAESAAIVRVYHTLTAEENGLWNALQAELETVNKNIAGKEREAPVP